MTSLDSALVARAIPAGSERQLSYLFAAPLLRAPLLGVYALLAEWLSLIDPAMERTVAQIKLAWWHEEMTRLVAGGALHPVSRYLAAQPGASAAHFSLLTGAVEAALLEVSGVPLELGDELPAHSAALIAGPLRTASLIAAAQPLAGAARAALERCTQALAAAQYLSRALREYRRAAACGRVPFPVDELLRAGIDNHDLSMAQTPPHLATYLQSLRSNAEAAFVDAAAATPLGARADFRHLLVLAALGAKHLRSVDKVSAFTVLSDMLLAWTTARRAT